MPVYLFRAGMLSVILIACVVDTARAEHNQQCDHTSSTVSSKHWWNSKKLFFGRKKSPNRSDHSDSQHKTVAEPVALKAKPAPSVAVSPSAVPTNAVPTNAVPTNTVPTNAVPTNAVPTNAVPTNAVPTNTVPTSHVPPVPLLKAQTVSKPQPLKPAAGIARMPARVTLTAGYAKVPTRNVMARSATTPPVPIGQRRPQPTAPITAIGPHRNNGTGSVQLDAPMYPSPLPNIPYQVGGTMITNQAFAPHEMLHPHKYKAVYPPFYYKVHGKWMVTPFGVWSHDTWVLEGTEVEVNYKSNWGYLTNKLGLISGFSQPGRHH